MKPVVRIITISCNGRRHLEECLPTLLAQDYPADRFGVTVVDNGSTDGTARWVARHHPAVRVVRNERNEGFARANNRAAALETAEWLAFVNDDMCASPDWLSQLVETAERTSAACVAGTILDRDGRHIDFVGGGIDPYGHGYQVDYGAPAERLAGYATERELLFPCGGAMLVRRDVFLDSGGFDDDFFAYYEDVDFGWRLWLLGHRVVIAPRATTLHRHHGTSSRFATETRNFHLERNALATIYKNYGDEDYLRYLAGAVLLRVARLFEGHRLDLGAYSFTAPRRNRLRAAAVGLVLRLRAFRKAPRMLVHVAAVVGFLRQLPELQQKRRAIQARRRRTDAEIFARFERTPPLFRRARFRELFDEHFREPRL